MYRPLIIVGAFLAATVGLIFFQPDSHSTQKVTAEIAPALTEPAPTKPPAAAAVVEVTRAETVAIAVPTPPIETAALETLPVAQTVAEPDEVEAPLQIAAATVIEPTALFSGLAKDRPQLLTTTSKGADGTLRPSLLPLMQNASVAATGGVLPQVEPDNTAVAALVLEARPTPLEVPDVAASVAAAPVAAAAPILAPSPAPVGNAKLRAALAAAPTMAVHTVRLGDSLTTLALRYFDDSGKTEIIVEANRRSLGDAATLKIGQILRIPDISGL